MFQKKNSAISVIVIIATRIEITINGLFGFEIDTHHDNDPEDMADELHV